MMDRWEKNLSAKNARKLEERGLKFGKSKENSVIKGFYMR
jgi:hypothetical protein